MAYEPTKREVVEEWLNQLCSSCEGYKSMEDDYHPGEYESEIDALVKLSEGLIHFVQYEPGSDEWENFDPEGWLWSTPSDAQVERLYSTALADLDITEDGE